MDGNFFTSLKLSLVVMPSAALYLIAQVLKKENRDATLVFLVSWLTSLRTCHLCSEFLVFPRFPAVEVFGDFSSSVRLPVFVGFLFVCRVQSSKDLG